MKKQRILIASVLKPVDDVRMFEKMGVSLSDSGLYETFIAGFPGSIKPEYPHIHFFPTQPFKRLSLKRLFAPWTIFKIVWKIRPDLLIITTHELLFIGILAKLFKGVTVIYDIQENYYRNIRYTSVFPNGIKQVLAFWVRFKEIICSSEMHWFFLAEQGYASEIRFHGEGFTIIENKSKVQFIAPRLYRGNHLLFSGTLAESTGVFEAIHLAKGLHAVDDTVTLTIIGYTAVPAVLRKIESEIRSFDFIHLIGGNKLVSHTEIIRAIRDADYGVVSYPLSLHTENAVPTKLYEYLACQLPMLLQNHEPWIRLTLPYPAAITVDFKNVDPVSLLNQMKKQQFYITSPVDVSWESEEKKLLETIKILLGS